MQEETALSYNNLQVRLSYGIIVLYDVLGGFKMQEDLRASLIKQFPSEVIEITESNGKSYYACPACNRVISRNEAKCMSCNQILSWTNIQQQEKTTSGTKMATLSFEVPGDFAIGNCRKCPLSYIARVNSENVYECPLKMRTACGLKIL